MTFAHFSYQFFFLGCIGKIVKQMKELMHFTKNCFPLSCNNKAKDLNLGLNSFKT